MKKNPDLSVWVSIKVSLSHPIVESRTTLLVTFGDTRNKKSSYKEKADLLLQSVCFRSLGV